MGPKNIITFSLLFLSIFTTVFSAEEGVESLQKEIKSLRKQLEDLEGEIPRRILSALRKEVTTDQDLEGCGGSININSDNSVSYSRPAKSQSDDVCVWVIYSNETAKLGLKIQELNLGDGNSTKLVVHSNLWADSQADVVDIRKDNSKNEIVVDSYLAILVFSSNSTSDDIRGFNLTLRNIEDKVKGNETEFGVVTVNRPNNLLQNKLLWTLAYPFEGGEYANNERTFFLFYPGAGRKMVLSMEFSDTEPHVDFLSVFVYAREDSKFIFDTKFSGRKQSGQYLYESDVNSPILLFFYTDSSSTYSGFKVNYSFSKA